MRLTAVVMTGLVIGFLVACSSSSTSLANSCGSSGAGANINAEASLSFSPKAVTITHGEKVCWQNSSSVAHTVTADSGAFDSQLPVGQIFVQTFPTAGTFPYHCRIHAGMTGTVTVN